jgi:hypothetical protein
MVLPVDLRHYRSHIPLEYLRTLIPKDVIHQVVSVHHLTQLTLVTRYHHQGCLSILTVFTACLVYLTRLG